MPGMSCSMSLPSGTLYGKSDHIFDAPGARGEHHDPIKAQCNAGAIRQTEAQCLQQAFVDGWRLHGARPAKLEIGVEACALFGGIRQLVKAVRKLDAFEVDLEALGNAWVVG